MCNLNRAFSRLAMFRDLLFSPEPKLEVNGSSVKFKMTGDLEVKAKRHLISDYQLSFWKSDHIFVSQSVEAYAFGEKSYQRFVIMMELENLLSEANKILEFVADEIKPKASERLKLIQVEIALMKQTVKTVNEEDEDQTRMVMNRAAGIRQMLISYLQNPKAFEPKAEKSQEQILKEIIEKSNPGLKVMKVERGIDSSDTSGFSKEQLITLMNKSKANVEIAETPESSVEEVEAHLVQ